MDAHEAQLADVQRRFEEASERVESMISELNAVGASLPTEGPADPALESRIEALGAQVDELTDALARLDADASLRARDATAATLELERLLDAGTHRLVEVERAQVATAAELSRVGGALAEERTWVRDQLDGLAAAVDSARPDETVEPRLQELATRIDAMEQGQRIVGVEVARIAAAWDAERDELKRQLESVAESVTSAPVGGVALDEQAERVLTDLAARLAEMEREGTSVAAEISHAESRWAAELSSLESRLEEIAGAAASAVPGSDPRTEERYEELLRRLDSLELDLSRPSSSAPGDPDELRDLRVLINGLRMRIASSEKELAALSGSGDVVPRLDDLSVRLSLLERTAAAAPVHAPEPGDGRFRVELRGLDQRMQGLETAAQENRDAVLTQFERLASRLQWRLQQLELETSDAAQAPPEPAQLGQVVPIRGEA